MVLTAAQKRYMTTRGLIDSRDRTQLESYIASIESIRSRVHADLSGRTIACVQPSLVPEEGQFFHYFYDCMAAATRQAIDLLALAIACDLTRVGLLHFGIQDYRDTPTRVRQDTAETDYHSGWEHHTNGEPKTVRDQVILTGANFNYASMAYLIQQLKAIPEGEGSVFDNTLILGLHEFSEGSHQIMNAQPYILAGSCGGHFRTGQYRNYSTGNPDEAEYRGSLSEPSRFGAHNDLMLSILRAFGVSDSTFGDPRFCTGPLAGLTV